MSLDSALRKAMGGVRPSGDLLRPNKRPRFSDVSKSAFPSLQQLQGVQDSGGTINLQSNSTLTLKFMPKPRRERIDWTQGTLIFYYKTEEKYVTLHEVNKMIGAGQTEFSKDEMEAIARDKEASRALLRRFRATFNFIGIFRNVMPDSLGTRQPVIGLDVCGRTNVQDLTKRHAQVGDELFLALTFKEVERDVADGDRPLTFHLVPCLNRNWKSAKVKPHDIIVPEEDDRAGPRCCTGKNVAAYMRIGTCSHRPNRPKRRFRESAWRDDKKAKAMNLVEVILA